MGMTAKVPALEISAAAVELRGVSKRYTGQQVLDNVDLAIKPGEFFALLGPSGSGKSTILRMVSGIEVPDSGQVWLGGKNVTQIPPYRRPVHTVFQNYALFPHLNVADNVGFPLRVAGMSAAERQPRIQKALGWVRMDHFSSRRIDGLSGGERQRVALARALVDEPQCVLLDEPLSALDPHLRGQTLELLQEIQARLQATYLYVTHDREEALRAAHRIGVLHHGCLQQVGTPEDIYQRPQTAFVASFVGPITWLRGEPASHEGKPALRLADGQLVPCMKPPPPGKVLLGIRPEDIRLGPDGFLVARVTHRQFSGAAVSLRLQTDSGIPIAADVHAAGSPPQAGEQVRLSWEPGRAHCFVDDGSLAAMSRESA